MPGPGGHGGPGGPGGGRLAPQLRYTWIQTFLRWIRMYSKGFSSISQGEKGEGDLFTGNTRRNSTRILDEYILRVIIFSVLCEKIANLLFCEVTYAWNSFSEY